MSERDDTEANRRRFEALVGGRTRWREHIEQGTKVLDIQWDKLPLSFRRQWWKATSYGAHLPTADFAAQMPELLAVKQSKLESAKREIAADTARARELLSQARQARPCEQCLRPASPCKERCLRSVLEGPGPS